MDQFAELTRREVKRGAYRFTRTLKNAIRSYLNMYNQGPKPLIWHKTADEILTIVGTTVNESPTQDT